MPSFIFCNSEKAGEGGGEVTGTGCVRERGKLVVCGGGGGGSERQRDLRSLP